ncbi:uncharacterized protein LOC112589299 [Harpegnathos saltator]|uniref:uncharacterized protein LOC112589299 n=1 Tax=Harpegnathos saltator TaxID=610380 RepID=UPI000DBED548|nr:uncharacterized protein LOC112589299 [Harpegnathos saltator]
MICDSPAKAFILMVKSHSGYESCTKCCIHGDYIENTICFPGFCDVLRTDEMFKNFNYNLDYQNKETKLINIPYFELVSNVPLDYMHLVCLGVMRKLIQLWLNGPINKNVRFQSNIVHEISNALTDFVQFIPSDFNRKPRALKYLKYWKATEFRLFLLYLGPVILRKHLRKDLYNHFLELYVAITILASPVLSLHDVNVSYAGQLLNHFVSSFETLYGKRYISHNVHNLQHIAADVKKYGALDNFSAFRFENFIGTLIKLVKKGEKPLQQISRRLKEYELTSQKKIKISGNLIRLEQRHYNDNKNNCCLLDDGSIVEALNFVLHDNIPYVIGREFVKLKSLYEYPMSSSDFSIHVCKVNDVLLSWLCSFIRAKLLKLPKNNKKAHSVIIFPILHTKINYM